MRPLAPKNTETMRQRSGRCCTADKPRVCKLRNHTPPALLSSQYLTDALSSFPSSSGSSLRPAGLFRLLLWRHAPSGLSPKERPPLSGFFLQESFSSGFQLRLRPRLSSRYGKTCSRLPVPGSDGKGSPPREVTTEVPLTGAEGPAVHPLRSRCREVGGPWVARGDVAAEAHCRRFPCGPAAQRAETVEGEPVFRGAGVPADVQFPVPSTHTSLLLVPPHSCPHASSLLLNCGLFPDPLTTLFVFNFPLKYF